jgi:glycerol uptake operon antiterminator
MPTPRNYEDFKYALILYLDLLSGIGKDKAGITFLARMGIAAVITD